VEVYSDKTSYVKSSEIIAKNPLSYLENAKIDPRKLTDYALNLDRPIGQCHQAKMQKRRK
jgi:hypothetical protein